MTLRSVAAALFSKTRGFLRRHGKLRLLLYGLPILAILWALGGALGFLGGLLQFLGRVMGPLLSSPGGRFLLLNFALLVFLWIFYRRFRHRFRRTLALAVLKNFLAGLRAVAGRDPGHAVVRFRRAARWARLVAEPAKALPEIPDLLGHAQSRLALALADTGRLEEGMRVLLRARAGEMTRETRLLFEEAQALLYARHPDVLEETVEAGLRSAVKAHPKSAPLKKELRAQLVRARRFSEATEVGAEILPLVDGRAREEEARHLSRLHLLVAGESAERGDAKPARAALRRAAALEPEDPFSALLLGELEARAGNAAGALREWRRAPSLPALDRMGEMLSRGELSPADAIRGLPVAGSLAVVARHHLGRGDAERARRAARLALDLGGPDPATLLLLADAEERAGRAAEAARLAGEAAAAALTGSDARDLLP